MFPGEMIPRLLDAAGDPPRFAESARSIVLMEMVESLAQGTPLVALTGPAGAGKTIMAAALDLELRGQGVQVMRVRRGEAGDVGLRTLSSQLLGKPEADFTVNDVEALHEVMLPSEAPTQRSVIIIDDAELLRDDALECLRLLSGVTTRRMPQIVFIGDSTLWDRVDRAAEADLRARSPNGGSWRRWIANRPPARELAAEPGPVATASPSPIACWPPVAMAPGHGLRRHSRGGHRGRRLGDPVGDVAPAGAPLASVDTCSGGGRVSCQNPRRCRLRSRRAGRAQRSCCPRASCHCARRRAGRARPLRWFRRGRWRRQPRGVGRAIVGANGASAAGRAATGRGGATCDETITLGNVAGPAPADANLPADQPPVAEPAGPPPAEPSRAAEVPPADRDGRAGQRSGACSDGCQLAR